MSLHFPATQENNKGCQSTKLIVNRHYIRNTHLFLVAGPVGLFEFLIQEVQAELINGWLKKIIFHQAVRDEKCNRSRCSTIIIFILSEDCQLATETPFIKHVKNVVSKSHYVRDVAPSLFLEHVSGKCFQT